MPTWSPRSYYVQARPYVSALLSHHMYFFACRACQISKKRIPIDDYELQPSLLSLLPRLTYSNHISQRRAKILFLLFIQTILICAELLGWPEGRFILDICYQNLFSTFFFFFFRSRVIVARCNYNNNIIV